MGVVPEAPVDAGHADQDDRQVMAVVAIAEDLENGWREAFGFVDDEELAPFVGVVAIMSSGDLPDETTLRDVQAPETPADGTPRIDRIRRLV
jgi:hypothetical protein